MANPGASVPSNPGRSGSAAGAASRFGNPGSAAGFLVWSALSLAVGIFFWATSGVGFSIWTDLTIVGSLEVYVVFWALIVHFEAGRSRRVWWWFLTYVVVGLAMGHLVDGLPHSDEALRTALTVLPQALCLATIWLFLHLTGRSLRQGA